MGNPPDREPGGGHGRRNRMISRAKKRPASAPPTPRRRRPIMPALRRTALWTALLLLIAGVYGGFVLRHLPAGQAILAEAADRVVAASAALGLVVSNIEVEGRET